MAKSNLGNSQDLVGILSIHDDTVVLKNGGLCQILIVSGINFSLKSEAEQDIITRAYQNFLNSLNFPLQIIVHSRKINIEKYLAVLDARRGQEKSGLLADQIKEYQEFVRGFVKDNAIMQKSFFAVVPFVPVGLPTESQVAAFLPFLKKKDAGAEAKASAEAEQKNFETNLAQLRQRVTQVIEGLLAVSLEAAALKDEELIELFYNFYNPETVEKEKINLPK